jgi:putative membrane protein
MRLVVWLVRAALFFVLFAFALNNRHDAAVHWFFGGEWRTQMVFIVLAAFALGCAFGVLAMVPSWWRHRRVARRHAPAKPQDTIADTSVLVAPTTPEHPPRDGL